MEPTKCKKCKGAAPRRGNPPCAACKGSGWVTVERPEGMPAIVKPAVKP